MDLVDHVKNAKKELLAIIRSGSFIITSHHMSVNDDSICILEGCKAVIDNLPGVSVEIDRIFVSYDLITYNKSKLKQEMRVCDCRKISYEQNTIVLEECLIGFGCNGTKDGIAGMIVLKTRFLT